jgi:serine/threonine protein kinase
MNSMPESFGLTSSNASIKFRQKIGESLYAEVFRIYDAGQQSAIVKQIKPSELFPVSLNSLQQQYLQWREIRVAQIQTPHLIDKTNASIITWDWQRPTLTEWLLQHDVCHLDVFFEIAKGLAACLNMLAEHKLFHGGIKPSNILIDPLTLEVRLTDVLRLIDYRNHSSIYIADPYFLQHVLPYLAPEQTGRLNQPLGPATDIYGLGCVFYRMLVGRPAFAGYDPVKIVHSIMAEQPVPPHKLNPLLPEPLSLCINRMLA